jgi:hypothetical protein
LCTQYSGFSASPLGRRTQTRPQNPSPVEAFLVAEEDFAPLLGCPALVAFREGEPLAEFLRCVVALVPGDASEEFGLLQASINGVSTAAEIELTSDLTGRGELFHTRDQRNLLVCALVRAARAPAARARPRTACRSVTCENCAHSVFVARHMPGNVSVASVVLVQGDDGPTLLFRQASGSTPRSRGGSRSRSGCSGEEVHSSVLYTIHKELCGVSDSPACSPR